MNKFPQDQSVGNKDHLDKDKNAGLGNKGGQKPQTPGSTIQKDRTTGGGTGRADQSRPDQGRPNQDNKWKDKR